ncbi:MAG: ABC transporter permease [Nanoarchaeota archaeon]
MITDYMHMAYKNLLRRRLRSWLTLVGIVIGLTAVVALIGLGQGLQVAVSDLFGTLGTDMITIKAGAGFGPHGVGTAEPLTRENVDYISRLAGVSEATGRLEHSAEYGFNNKQRRATFLSMPIDNPDRLRLLEYTFDLEVAEGRLLSSGDYTRIVVGSRIAELDDHFKRDIRPGVRFEINEQTYEVIGVLKRQGDPSIDRAIYMSEEDMRNVFALPRDEVDMIILGVENEDEIREVQADIENYLRRVRGVDEGDEDFSVETAEDIMADVNSTIGTIAIFVYLIAGISILVGGIGIMNTMFMSVTERIREIGIMKSIGARNETIFSMFFFESGLLGAIGGLIGASLGALISIIGASILQNFVGGGIEISAQISPLLFGGCIIGSFLLGSIFGSLPAYRASRLHPVDAIRTKK